MATKSRKMKRSPSKVRTQRAKRSKKTARALAGESPAGAARDRAFRQHVIELLRGGHAHLTFDHALDGLAADLRAVKPAGFPHSIWQLLEHLRIAQWDILEFSRNPKHVSPKFPEGYWPEAAVPADDAAWEASVQAFRADLKALEDLVTDPKGDVAARIPHGEGQTILREAMLAADHNAYHLGQIVLVRRLLGAWKD